MRGERREVFWFPEKVRRAQAGICAAFGVTEQVSRRSRRFALSWIVANPNPNEGQQHRATKVTTCNTLPGISGISAGRHPGRLLGASHMDHSRARWPVQLKKTACMCEGTDRAVAGDDGWRR